MPRVFWKFLCDQQFSRNVVKVTNVVQNAVNQHDTWRLQSLARCKNKLTSNKRE